MLELFRFSINSPMSLKLRRANNPMSSITIAQLVETKGLPVRDLTPPAESLCSVLEQDIICFTPGRQDIVLNEKLNGT